MRVSEYLLSVTCAAFICAILRSVGGEKGQIKLLCGIFLALSVVRPLIQIRLDSFLPLYDEINAEAAFAVSAGEEYSTDAMADIISSRMEAYILDKASGYGAHLTVEIFTAGEGIPVPASVRIRGHVSPYVKKQLQEIIQQELGICLEDQLWME